MAGFGPPTLQGVDMPLVGFVKMLVDMDRPELNEKDREKIIESLRELHDGPCKKDPILGMILGILQKAIHTSTEEDAAYLLDMWSDQMSHIAAQSGAGGLFESILKAALLREAVDCQTEEDIMQQYAKCEECEKKGDCPAYADIKERALSNGAKVTN